MNAPASIEATRLAAIARVSREIAEASRKMTEVSATLARLETLVALIASSATVK
jgi:hypothetical protein